MNQKLCNYKKMFLLDEVQEPKYDLSVSFQNWTAVEPGQFKAPGVFRDDSDVMETKVKAFLGLFHDSKLRAECYVSKAIKL